MKIRGNVVGTPLKPERNLLKATDLTEQEKAQVRENIGIAGVLTVTIDSNKASHTPAEILAHINSGGSVYCNGFALQYVTAFEAVFEDNFYSGHEGSDGKPYAYCMTRTVINEDGTVTESLKNLPTLNDGETTEYNTWSSQKIASEIGSIETALDGIIAIQNSLIGGGEV